MERKWGLYDSGREQGPYMYFVNLLKCSFLGTPLCMVVETYLFGRVVAARVDHLAARSERCRAS